MFIKIINNKKGYSLLETIVYIALFSLISTVILSFISISSKIYGTARVNNLITESGNTAIESITRNIRSASSVTANSVFGSSSGVLELLNTDGKIVKIYLLNGVVTINENGVLVGGLTNQNLTVSSLIFYKITTTNSVAIKTELILSHAGSGKTEQFQTTTTLRNSY